MPSEEIKEEEMAGSQPWGNLLIVKKCAFNVAVAWHGDHLCLLWVAAAPGFAVHLRTQLLVC